MVAGHGCDVQICRAVMIVSVFVAFGVEVNVAGRQCVFGLFNGSGAGHSGFGAHINDFGHDTANFFQMPPDDCGIWKEVTLYRSPSTKACSISSRNARR